MTERINLLDLDEATITRYSLVRHMGFINQYNPGEKGINAMLEGAQRINDFGRESIKPESEHKYVFTLSSLQWAYFQRILADAHFNNVYEQMTQRGGLSQENLKLLWSGHFDNER